MMRNPTTTKLAEPLRLPELEQLFARGATEGPHRLPRVLVRYTWTDPHNQKRAIDAYQGATAALGAGRAKDAEMAWRTFQNTVQADQMGWARRIALDEGLPVARAGRGPLPHRPVLHRQPRCTWRIYPLEGRHGIRLPEETRLTLARWEERGSPFFSYYLADEVPVASRKRLQGLATARVARAVGRGLGAGARAAGRVLWVPVATAALVGAGLVTALSGLDPVLLGVISVDGQEGEWYVLQRWTHR